MPRISILHASFLVMMLFATTAWGQNLLDKVEKALDSGSAPAGDAKADPAAPAERAADDLPPPAPEREQPTSGYLGVGLEDTPIGGIVVVEVAADSPAAKAGLKVGDKITSANKEAVTDIDELGTIMGAVPPGGKLALGINRIGKAMTITATLVDPPKEKTPAASDPAATEPGGELGSPLGPQAGDLPPPAVPGPAEVPRAAASGRASLGITVVTFDEENRRRTDVPVRSGALITQIRPQSPADRAGLPVGGVIVRYEGQRIETADELVAAIAASHPGDEVELSYYQGDRLASKTVTLVAAADPSLLSPGTGDLLRDRPLLNRVEGAIEGLTRPEAGIGDGPAAIPGVAVPAAADASLKQEVETLKARIATLESRLEELEAKLAAPRPAPDAGAGPAVEPPAEGPADEGPPTLRPPARRPPTKAPKLKIGDE